MIFVNRLEQEATGFPAGAALCGFQSGDQVFAIFIQLVLGKGRLKHHLLAQREQGIDFFDEGTAAQADRAIARGKAESEGNELFIF